MAEIEAVRKDLTGQVTTSRGPIENALETWQQPPPAHGSDYLAYRQSGTLEGESGDEAVTVTTWVDERTRYPLKQRLDDAAGQTVLTFYWVYAIGRLELGEVPENFFAADRPAQPGMEQEINHGGTEPLGPIQDEQTGVTFNARFLGPTLATSRGGFALLGSDVVRQRTGPITAAEALAYEPPPPEPGAPPDPDPDPPEDAMPPGEDDVFPDTQRPDAGAVEPSTSVNAYYRQTAGVPQDPDDTHYPLWVSTWARGSADAQGWRDVYTEHATAIQLDPTDHDYLRAGPVPVTVGAEPTVAYVLAIDEDRTSALIDVGEVMVIIEGRFEKSDLPSLVSNLRGFS